MSIRYIDGCTRVVQAENKIGGYYFYFVLEFILLILGILIILGGLQGKNIYDTYMPKQKKAK